MFLILKTKPALLTTVIIITLLLSWFVGSVTEHEIRNAFLMQTQIGANSIDINHLKNLTGTTADFKSPDYLLLKHQMASIRKVDKNLYFVYLMGVKNGKVFFYVDDRPDGHPEGSPPGSPYDEAPKEFNKVMQTGIPTVEGPSADSWGSFASGCAPVIDPKTGKTIAIFAIDFVTSSWYWRIISYAAIPVGLVIVLMLLILSNIASKRKGKLIKSSEKKYRFMFDNNPQPNWIYDFETLSFLEVNEAAIIHYGYSKEEFLSMTLKDIRPVEDIPLFLEDVKQAGKTYYNAGEWRHFKKNGELIYVEVVSHPVTFNGRNSRHVLVHDVTDRRLAEKTLMESEAKYRFMFDNNPQPNWIYDFETLSFLEVNQAALLHYGYSKEEFLSMTLKDIRPVEDIPALLEGVTLSEEAYYDAGEWRHFKKNGELIYVEIISHPVIFNGRNSRHILVHDITDRKLTEVALRQANTELENLHNNLEEAVFSVDLIHNKIIYASIAHQAVFGYSPSEFIKNPQLWYEIIVPEDKPNVDARIPFLATGKNISFEYRIADPNGQLRWIETKIKPTLDENGSLTRIDGIASDITKRKHIETELLESEINFRRSISESPVGIRIVSVIGKTIYANRAFLDIYEFNSLEEFTSTPAKLRYTPESYEQHQERKEKRKSGNDESDYEISIICKNGDIRHVKVSSKEVLWNGIKHFQVINLNITEQRNAEEQLRKLSRAVEQSPDAICITDPEGIIEYVNPITNELSGYTMTELAGRNTNIFSSGEKTKEEYAELWQIIKSGNVWSGELHNKKKNGELYWESTTISPIFDNKGRITHFLAIKEDITLRKRAETALNKSEEQLRKFASHLQSIREEEKMALAREIHDDLGQILVALKIDMGMLKQKVFKTNTFADSSDILPKFDNIVDLIDKTIKTTRRIMNGLRPELLELHGFVGATQDYLREFEDRHRISCEFACNISDIEMDQQQSLAFFRIFQEAMSNIAKHSKATLVKIQLQCLDNKLCMEIIDNGVGFDKNNNGRNDSYGMLGMKERVILLEGTLDITSEVGQGTSVRVEMPYRREIE